MTENQTPDTSDIASGVAKLWADLLKRDDVPHDVTFPELGGDSLLLIALLTRIEESFDVYLEAEDILDDLTVTGMARAIAQAPAAS
ncbi:phosphopantetheine-binding protein [Streptomyces sp. NPDC058486]|uniref:phosphopantetheine-binding protein n=1 Tax=unclassified Streptomyces TaxID=2593676 RepID=UPI00364ACA0F